ncbi:hypothetical protein KR054_003937 [Drosophila jambulina]|nr:hypothetical protein KR054_003937 [Drosophila jambulina]
MSKRVSIVLPDEMPSGLPKSKSASRQSKTILKSSIKARASTKSSLEPSKAILKSSMTGSSSTKSSLEPPVFLFVSPEFSCSSEVTTPRTTNTSPSESSFGKWVLRESSTGGSDAEVAANNSALVRTGSSINSTLKSSSSSIKQFLRNTVALVRAGQSFTSVKRLFYNFIKQYSSRSDEGSTSGGNPYLCQSNDTLMSNLTPHLTTPSTSQMDTCTHRCDYSFNPLKYDRRTSWLFEVSPLTGYTPGSTQLSTREAGYQSDVSQKSYASKSQDVASFQAPLKSPESVSISEQPKSQEVVLAKSDTPPPAEGGLPGSLSQKNLSPEQAQDEEIKTSPGLPETLNLLSDVWTTSHIRRCGGASSRSLPKIPNSKSISSPQSDAPTTAVSEPIIMMFNTPEARTEDNRLVRMSGSSQSSRVSVRQASTKKSRVSPITSIHSWMSQKARPSASSPRSSQVSVQQAPRKRSRVSPITSITSWMLHKARSSASSRRSSQVSVQQAARKRPKVSPITSITSGMSQQGDNLVVEEPSSQIERISRSSEGHVPRTGKMARKVNFVFTMVSPEEARPSQPGENSSDKAIEESSTCRTFQEECKCHHCQDMRRALKKLEYFQSPEGQKRMESKLLAKNFFMDLCAMSEVRKEIQADLYGTRTHPPARVSYPVSICGASRLDGGSLTLNWFVHDLECIDHFDFFVDGKRSKSLFNTKATSTVLIDVKTSSAHRLMMRAVPVRGYGAQSSPVDKLMSEVAAGHMRNVRQGQLFAKCLQFLDAEPQRSLVDYWTDSEFLYMPADAKQGR